MRYYSEPNMRPSSLKQTIALGGCTVNESESKGKSIVLNLPEGKVLCMEAVSKEDAADWKKVLQESIDALNAKSTSGKTRRANVANETSDATDGAPLPVRYLSNRDD